MAKVEKHPTQKDKYQCPICDYGHNKGKSRQAVYKHYAKAHESPEISPESQNQEHFEFPSFEVSEQDDDKIEFDDWGDISWMTSEEEEEIIPHTIPDPIKKLAGGKEGQELLIAHRTMTKSMIRWSFMGLDRMIGWWGKGVTNNPDYELKRSREDYDVLQNSTITMMDAYGIRMPASPIMVWSTIVGSAYVPAIIDINRKADPSKKGVFRAILRRMPIIGKRLRAKQQEELRRQPNAINR